MSHYVLHKSSAHLMDDLVKQRVSKLEALKKAGINCYGGRFEKSAAAVDIINNFQDGKEIKIAGRLMTIRTHGKSVFCDIKDATGKIQIYLKKDIIGDKQFDMFVGQIDIGDIIGVTGTLFKTKTDEITINVKEFILLSKALRPLPEKWHGLKDIETRYRQRYLDLLANEDVKNTFITRTNIINKTREYLNSKGYLEVETPMLQPIPGGAAGRPFKTHHNAFDIDLYLRIAPELYLKRLLVAGFEKVYEINKSFRNEGVSTRHNPEFTMLEVYTAYADYKDMMALTEELIKFLAKGILGKTKIEFQGNEIDLEKWQTVSFADLMKDNFGIDANEETTTWIDKIKRKGIGLEQDELSRTKIINILGEILEPKVKSHPVFVTDLFTELCPLAKTKKDNPHLTERFELFIAGIEVANAYSELNDPIEQMERFKKQQQDLTDQESLDEDFVRALEYGMPPAGGLGIGIDRLVMLFTNNSSIKDVILFPQLKPQEKADEV